MPLKRVYFPNLNGLRGIAATMVLIFHVEWQKKAASFINYFDLPWIRNLGEDGVSLFFVLSGFLITYLLLEELNTTGDISIGTFYIRRILRIWPLYYLTVFAAFFVLPHFVTIPGLEIQTGSPFWTNLTMCILLVPNLCLLRPPSVPFASQLWSVGVEEQFYLVWPWVVRTFAKRLMWVMLGIALVSIGLRVSFVRLASSRPSPFYHDALIFSQYFRIQSMAFGGIGAYLIASKRAPLLTFIYSKPAQMLALGLAIFIHSRSQGVMSTELLSVLYALIIMNLAANPGSIVTLESKIFLFLGKISYGLYMYNILAIRVSLLLLAHTTGYCGNIPSFILLYLLSFSLTVLLSAASYYYIERRALQLKERFSPVMSDARIAG